MSEALFRYVALGDSTGVGVGADDDGGYPERLYRLLKADGVPAGILNLAVSGARSQDVAQKQAQAAASKKPALVTLGIGINDLWRLVPVGTFELNLKLIANALEASGAHVVVTNLPDLTLAPIAALIDSLVRLPIQVFEKRLQEMNEKVAALARRPRFTVVDLYGLSREELRGRPEFFSPDGFHPSALGYDRWTQIVWPTVQQVAKDWMAARG